MTATANDAPAWIGNANNAFAADLYGKLAAQDQGNLFFSPASIETALAMTWAGASGDTASQMAAVLHLPAGSKTVSADFGSFLAALNAPNDSEGQPRGYQLSIANALWAEQSYTFLPAFLDALKTNYGAGVENVDFKNDAAGARDKINSWVEKQTNDKIKNLIGPGVLTSMTRMVLTNAIYFKGTWASQFSKKATHDEPFHMTATQQKNMPMMHQTDEFGYTEDQNFQALELPYAGNDLSMIIVLPKAVDGLAAMEKEIAKLPGALEGMDRQRVVVTIPKFQLTEEFELGPELQALGMTDAFGGSADFSGMTGNKDLSISNVIHKAFVDVNEQGTEAAAATGVVMAMAMARPEGPPPEFRADHPFLFVIRDDKTGAFLFMGRLAAPQ